MCQGKIEADLQRTAAVQFQLQKTHMNDCVCLLGCQGTGTCTYLWAVRALAGCATLLSPSCLCEQLFANCSWCSLSIPVAVPLFVSPTPVMGKRKLCIVPGQQFFKPSPKVLANTSNQCRICKDLFSRKGLDGLAESWCALDSPPIRNRSASQLRPHLLPIVRAQKNI